MSRHVPSRRTSKTAANRISSERGSALFLLLIMAVVMATIMAGIYAYIGTAARAEKRSNVRLESIYAAEYAFEQAYQNLNTLINTSTQNAPDVAQTSAVTNLTTAPTSVYGAADGYTWLAYLTVPVQDGYPTDAFTNFNPQLGVYRYLTVVEFSRQVGNMHSPVHMQFQRQWDYALTPLFQYAIFYNGDMELFPGAQFVVDGKVHSNGIIYTGTTASISFNDTVTYVNNIVTGQYSQNDPRAPQTMNGAINFNRGPAAATNPKNPPGVTTANLTDGNYNNDGPRELIEIPYLSQTDINSWDRLYTKAGLKVLVNSTSTDVTTDSGVLIPAATKTVLLIADGALIPTSDPLYKYLTTPGTQGTVTNLNAFPSGTFKDYREGTTLTTTNVNVSQINAAYNAAGLPNTIPNAATWPTGTPLAGQAIDPSIRGKPFWNGILYVTDVTNSAAHRTGVQIVNGASLPDGTGHSGSAVVPGLTVASNNAAYIVGDYNTGGVPPVDNTANALTASNAAGTGSNAYPVQPAAVIADAVTVVSSSWISGNYNTQPTLANRPATSTTINAALISGTVQSVKTGANAAYSGGVENYIRLLEDWSGKRLTYYGSMVNLYNSQQSMAKWITTGTYYNAPVRNWYFDVQYLNPNRLPPGTPIIRTLLPGQWVQIE